jgi:hypothetical protein
MTSEQLTTIAGFARAELLAQHVERPSVAAMLEQVRRVVAVGRGAEAGMHTIAGVVEVVVLDGVDNGFAPGEFLLDVRGVKLDPVHVRRIAGEWLAGAKRRGIVRVREASALDLVRAWWRWTRLRSRARGAVHAVAR